MGMAFHCIVHLPCFLNSPSCIVATSINLPSNLFDHTGYESCNFKLKHLLPEKEASLKIDCDGNIE
jgi:hypothetical protein